MRGQSIFQEGMLNFMQVRKRVRDCAAELNMHINTVGSGLTSYDNFNQNNKKNSYSSSVSIT